MLFLCSNLGPLLRLHGGGEGLVSQQAELGRLAVDAARDGPPPVLGVLLEVPGGELDERGLERALLREGPAVVRVRRRRGRRGPRLRGRGLDELLEAGLALVGAPVLVVRRVRVALVVRERRVVEVGDGVPIRVQIRVALRLGQRLRRGRAELPRGPEQRRVFQRRPEQVERPPRGRGRRRREEQPRADRRERVPVQEKE